MPLRDTRLVNLFSLDPQYRDAGSFLGFYRGIDTTIARAASLGATKMCVYDIVKQKLRGAGLGGLPLIFCSSFCAGLAITLAAPSGRTGLTI